MAEQEILNGAVNEEWTHFTEDGNYLLNDDGHFFYWNDFSQEWASCRGIKLLEVRSRKDIQTIVDLRAENEKSKKFTDFQSEVVENTEKELAVRDKHIAELEKERDELNKQCGEFQEGFFSYMAHCDHLQIEVDNLKKKITNLTTPDESKKSGGDA